jgi:hypothetical protein
MKECKAELTTQQKEATENEAICQYYMEGALDRCCARGKVAYLYAAATLHLLRK